MTTDAAQNDLEAARLIAGLALAWYDVWAAKDDDETCDPAADRAADLLSGASRDVLEAAVWQAAGCAVIESVVRLEGNDDPHAVAEHLERDAEQLAGVSADEYGHER